MKYRSRSAGQGACLNGMSRTITMQGFRLAAITAVEKTKLRRNNFQSQWTVKYRSRVLGQGACLNGTSRTITMQVSDSQLSLMSRKLNFDVNVDGRTDERTDGRTNVRKFELLYRTLL